MGTERIMNRRTLTAAAVALLLLLVAVLAAAWQDRARLAALRAEQAALRQRAEELGFRREDGELSLPAKRGTRPDPEAEARAAAARFAAHAMEMEALGDAALAQPDKALRERMIARMDEVARLDAGQLRILIGELMDSREIDDEQREQLVGFAFVKMLAKDPRLALDVLLDTPSLGNLSRRRPPERSEWLKFAISRWAEVAPRAALAWLRDREASMETDENGAEAMHGLQRGLIYGVSRTNPRLAMELANEHGINRGVFVTDVLEQSARTPEQRAEAVNLLREWQAHTKEDPELYQEAMARSLASLALGSAWQGYEQTAGWIDAQGFTPAELSLMTRYPFHASQLPAADRSRWMAWLGAELPPESAHEPARTFFVDWMNADPVAAKEWQGSAPDGPSRHAATSVIAEGLTRKEPQEALRLALTIPEGSIRTSTLKSLYDNWPRWQPSGQEAAEKMAEEYGVRR